jgi:hypothetical protein
VSYNITVKTHLGEAVVTVSGEVPDGEHAILGHEDTSERQLTVTRRGPDGRYIQQAGSIHHKET